MARILIERDGDAPMVHDLNWGLTRVGRGPDNDVVLADPSVSYHHCEFELGLDFLKVKDCGSTNGTYVGGRKVEEESLRSGTQLRLGQATLSVDWFGDTAVVVPKIEVQRPPESVPLGDGVMSCRNHNGIRALWHCVTCQQYFCLRCIRGVNLVGRPAHKLCPLCSGHVELAPWAMPEQKKKSLWGLVKKALSRTDRIG